MRQINSQLKSKIKEALSSVLPITVIVFILSGTVTPMPISMLLMFLLGAVLLIMGMGFFSLGADISMMPMGRALGARVTRTKKLGFIIPAFLILGIIITIAEPDLQVLAEQVPAIPNAVLVWTVAAGVGIFTVTSLLRTLFKIKLKYLLLIFYGIVFITAAFAPADFLAVAFDSGGVTTGPITVPFIMALGVGLASLSDDVSTQEDSFGMVALSSIGPILAVLLLGIFFNPSTANYQPPVISNVRTSQDVFNEFAKTFPHYFTEVVFALLPIIVVFILLQVLARTFPKRQCIKVAIGIVYTTVGLILFLTGVNVGFMPAGYFIGMTITASPYPWMLIILAMIMGWFIVSAEPAVHVLVCQVEEITNGAISQKPLLYSLSLGMVIALSLGMIRILTGISLFWFIIPGYAIAIALTFIVPPIFTGIAFDSGGVASGPMTATFLLPFAMGACRAVGGNILTDAFGIVALVAMTPLVTIQLFGLYYTIKAKHAAPICETRVASDDELIDFEDTEVS